VPRAECAEYQTEEAEEEGEVLPLPLPLPLQAARYERVCAVDVYIRLGTSWRRVGSFTPRAALLPRREPPEPTGQEGRGGGLSTAGLGVPVVVHPVTSRCTDRAAATPNLKFVQGLKGHAEGKAQGQARDRPGTATHEGTSRGTGDGT
jgi:hypothetical protein